MAEKKRPRRTRERIVATSLEMFNRHGERHVTTADIADEMNISPGNLYYHFRNKDEIIGELVAAYEASVDPLLVVPKERAANIEDLWLMLHLLFERMWQYRFIYRDLDDLASRNRRFASRIGELLRRGSATVRRLCESMIGAGSMRASPREIAALSQNVILVATYWMSFQKLSEPTTTSRAGEQATLDVGRAAYQVLALIAPFLVGESRLLLDRLSSDYL